ncbi:MAG: hypothetical protein CBCREVIR_3084, partial [Candidatus Burkholderia crenata]
RTVVWEGSGRETCPYPDCERSLSPACAPWASRAVRVFHPRFLQDATSKEPIEI